MAARRIDWENDPPEDRMVCVKCGVEKDLKRFRAWNGHPIKKYRRCIDCDNQRNRLLYASHGEDWYVRPQEKTCTRCKITQPASEFNIARNNKSGLSSHCKECMAKRSAAQARSGVLHAGRNGWARLKNSAKKRKYKVPLDITPEEYCEWWASTPDVCHYCGMTREEFVCLKEQVIAGGKNVSRFAEIFFNPYHARTEQLSVDRKDSMGGYTIGNICKCCWFCNYIKGRIISEPQMKLIAKSIIDDVRLSVQTTEE